MRGQQRASPVRGPLTGEGLYQAIQERGRKAGLPKVWVHQLRHTAAHMLLSAEMLEGDVMQVMGWRFQGDAIALRGLSGL
jgi:integrase